MLTRIKLEVDILTVALATPHIVSSSKNKVGRNENAAPKIIASYFIFKEESPDVLVQLFVSVLLTYLDQVFFASLYNFFINIAEDFDLGVRGRGNLGRTEIDLVSFNGWGGARVAYFGGGIALLDLSRWLTASETLAPHISLIYTINSSI